MMTPTTAEQMPDFELIDQWLLSYEMNTHSNDKSAAVKNQRAILRSWLAQGGARGGEDRVFNCRRCPVSVESRWIAPDCPECGDPCEYDPSAKPAPAALAPRAEAACEKCGGAGIVYVNEYHDEAPCPACKSPRAEAGEAVLTNPYTGTPRDYRDVESDPEGILIAVPGEPLRPHKPTAACGVSGLVKRWRDDVANTIPQGQMAKGLLWCADELEAALKANRGGVSDQQVEAAMTAYYAAFQHGKEPRVYYTEEQRTAAMRAALTAALNAGALAGGEWPADVAFVADVMPDWTTMQLPDGSSFAFKRENGMVYKLPHPDAPFIPLPPPPSSGDGHRVNQ